MTQTRALGLCGVGQAGGNIHRFCVRECVLFHISHHDSVRLRKPLRRLRRSFGPIPTQVHLIELLPLKEKHHET